MEYKKVRTKKDILNDPRVDSIHQEYDGAFEGDTPNYWCYLKPGFISVSSECGTIHEQTIKAVCDELNFSVAENGN